MPFFLGMWLMKKTLEKKNDFGILIFRLGKT